MKTFFSTLVFVLIALPFVYMAYDVAKDIFQQIKTILAQKSKPLVQSLVQIFNG